MIHKLLLVLVIVSGALVGYATEAEIDFGSSGLGYLLVAGSILLSASAAFLFKGPVWSGVYPGLLAGFAFTAGQFVFEGRYEGATFSIVPIGLYVIVYGVRVWLVLLGSPKLFGTRQKT